MLQPNQELIVLLRESAATGKGAAFLIELLKEHIEPEELNAFAVMNYFIHAFDLSLREVRELSGAYALGGGVYDDSEIDLMMTPHLKQ